MKKFTKILSLALALALVLSTNVFAATVYYAQDFSGYANIDELIGSMPTTEWNNGTLKTYQTATSAIAQREAGYNMVTATQYGTRLNASDPTLTTDASGIKWFRGITATFASTNNASGYATYLVVTPNNTWDYTSDAGRQETYVISYDIKVDPMGTQTKTVDSGHTSLWTNSAKTTNDTDGMFTVRAHIAAAGNTDVAVLGINNGQYGNGVLNDEDRELLPNGTNSDGSTKYETFNVLAKDRTYRFATTYKYDENYAWPYKETIVDGVVRGRATTNGVVSGHQPFTTADNPVLAAFAFGFLTHNREAISNIRMYTIGNNEVLGVNDIAAVVPVTNAKVTVKFTQPIYNATFDPAAVEIAGLKNGTDFTVGKVKDVVEGNNIYSAFDIDFRTTLAASATYAVTVPEDVKNELGTAIADTTATFETEKAPTYILALEGYEGLAAGTTQIAADAMAGKTVYFKATATNDTGRATSGVLAIGIYEGENLVKYAFANKTFATDGAVNTFSAAFKLEAGQTAKAFVTGSNSVVTYQ